MMNSLGKLDGGHGVSRPSAGEVRRCIEVIAPSGAHLSLDTFDRAVRGLRSIGYEVRCCVPRAPWQRFSDTDPARVEQIHRVARARDIDAVMIARGGYGLSRLLDRIDWPLVAASVARGVRWIGYSDFTAFQLALLAQTGAPSYAGPGVSGDFDKATLDPYMLAQFSALMAGRLLSVEWDEGLPAEQGLGLPVEPSGGQFGRSPGNPTETLAPGKVAEGLEGTLWGGNLSMVAALTGTPYLPPIDGGLLFLEDVAEHPYRIERMLHQLLHAGVLERQNAILLGAFTDWRAASHDNGYDLNAVASYFRTRLSIPIIAGLPFGHVPRKAVLGQGVRYRLERLERVGRVHVGRACPADPANPVNPDHRAEQPGRVDQHGSRWRLSPVAAAQPGASQRSASLTQ